MIDKTLDSETRISVAGTHHAYTRRQFDDLYTQSIQQPDVFWAQMAKRIDWHTFPTRIKHTDYNKDSFAIKWFEDGVLNACYNCVDRHADTTPDNIAITWQDDTPGVYRTYTYKDLKTEVATFANVLKHLGVGKGDVVTIYMPMVPQAVFAMLACARIGAVHSVVFGGFSADSLANRINDCHSKCVITADEARRGGKSVPLKDNVDKAIAACPQVAHVLVVDIGDTPVHTGEKDVVYSQVATAVTADCPCEPVGAEHPLFILYTSGSTGSPKGLVHTTGGYMVYANLTFETLFDYRQGEVYWCTADVGWITGHSYIVYGPLSAGANTLVFSGVPTYPDASRFWQIVDTHKVHIFYTAPTAIRALLAMGDSYLDSTQRHSLRILGSVGEPINVEAWEWYFDVVGHKRCPIVDTWWQTETGGVLMAPVPYLWDMKPSKATFPFFGVQPAIFDEAGNEVIGEGNGRFCMRDSWPGQARTIYNNQQRFLDTYFSEIDGYYFTGDGAVRDADGYIRITGRMDDVLNVSGHRLGTAEIEDAIDEHEDIAESAVVGYHHPIKGEGVYAFCIVKDGVKVSEQLQKDVNAMVREKIGPIANLDFVHFTPALPKTRSGKIMRRILRKIANQDCEDFGDVSTLTDPSVVDTLIKTMPKMG